ncbi:SWR1 complex bromodomain subunit bdf1 [Hypsizygus marmoreus]|uniref:SWR1 complex bromodomain subunit bdf1 n=1 Tax=Hypsizygus marmoreus TaxID=39966 RepID=A0A369K8E9_HYPMA|nr:SWR1 complex bromodomain subunit bdf1 [Hypsizygus marmoreus]
MNDVHSSLDGHAPVVPNGVHTPELVVNGDAKHISCDHHNADASPAADSPATPISNITAPDVKIDIDYQEQESDARHEPLPIKSLDSLDKYEDGSTIPQVGIADDPSTIPIHPPNGTPLTPSGEVIADMKMAEANPAPLSNGVNGGTLEDVVMHDADTETPATTPGLVHADSSMASIDANGASPAYSTPVEDHFERDDNDDKPPPAKRARMHSDADQASFAHSATPPPASALVSTASTPAPPLSSSSTLTPAQFRFSLSTIRSLKKLKDAGPFLRPVDHVALNIPHYPSIIKSPMDFSTIERKLMSSNPNKLDLNPQNPRYHTSHEFISDVRLIFQNCITFNGPDHAVSLMGKRVEQVFDKQIKQMPAATEVKQPAIVKKVATPPPPPPPSAPLKKPTVAARRPSTSVPVIRRSDTEAVGRPKREIHPPPPKDLTYADLPKKHRKAKVAKDDGTVEQLRFCSKLLIDLNRKQFYGIASPFYEPVDWVKLDLPSYPKMIKKPMDLSTMRKKLDSQLYPTAQKFFDDFKLMIRNCFLFNPAGTPVNQAGIELQRVFDEKWKHLPPLRDAATEDEDEDEDDDSEEDRQPYAGAIALMESQIEAMKGNIAALKSTKAPKEKKKKEKREKPPVASSSKVPTKQAKAPSKKKGKKPIADNDVLTFEQKKDLSESIAKLDEAKLEKVIQIIHEGVPEIRDSTEEIELEIDLLPASVLTKLYNFVIRPLRAPAMKRNRQGKGTGTGGLKRKSMDEDVEAEKIRLLEERMALFEGKSNGGGTLPTRRDHDSDHSSDSSSNSDSSGSDSE